MFPNGKITSCFSLLLDLIPVISTNSVDPDTIFSNNEMSLRDIEIYGFDYDYTLAFYSRHLHTLIFNIARDILITNHRVSVQGVILVKPGILDAFLFSAPLESFVNEVKRKRQNTVTVPLSKAFNPSSITSSDTKRLVVGTCVYDWMCFKNFGVNKQHNWPSEGLKLATAVLHHQKSFSPSYLQY